MSDLGVFKYTGNDLNCYQAWCWRWGHDFGDEVCKRCGDPVPNAAASSQGALLDLINAAVRNGATAGDVLTVEDGQGRTHRVTLGQTVPRAGRPMLVAIALSNST